MSDTKTFTITAPLPRDHRGFLAQRCPRSECGKMFQVMPGTGLKTDRQTCPYCGEAADSDQFTREEDRATAREAAMEVVPDYARNLAHDMLNEVFRNASCRSSLVSFRPGAPPPPPRTPRMVVYPDLDLETEVTCDACELVFRVYGVFGRCPDCANINAFVVLDADMTVCERRLARSRKAREEGDIEAADDQLWDTLGVVVGRFDALGKELRARHPARFPEKPRNLFQNLNALDKVLDQGFGRSLRDVAGSHHKALVLGFQARHLHEHNHDVVDEDFLRNTGEDKALKGRKYPLTGAQVEACIAAVRQVVGGVRHLLDPGRGGQA